MRILTALFAVALAGCATTPRTAADYSPDDDRKAIVGGDAAEAGQFPHQVSIGDNSWDHFCGGSIIGQNWVLTAAHCVVFEDLGSLYVEAGVTDLGFGVRNLVEEIVIHPDYDGNANDMALLRVGVDLTAIGGAIPLIDPATEDDFAGPGTMATVSGWGSLSSGGSSPNNLQYVDVPVVEQEICNSAYDGDISDDMVCAGFVGVGGADSCQGDSGGPLVVPAGTGWAQNGVVSWGYGCADAEFPGVYARVSMFSGWVAAYVPDVEFLSGDTPPPAEIEDDHGNNANDATVVDLDGNTEIEGRLTAGDIDVFKLRAPIAQSILLESSGDTDTVGTLYDGDGNLVAESDDDGDGFNFLLDTEIEEGNYYLHIRGFNTFSTGSYTLRIAAAEAPVPEDDHGDTPDDATWLQGGGTMTVQGALTEGDTDMFVFELAEDQTVEIFTNGDIDTLGELTSSTGVLLDDDSGENFNFSITADLEAGIHYVKVRGYQDTQAGAYQLVVVTNEGGQEPQPVDDHGDTFETATDVPMDDFSTGTLHIGDLDVFRIEVLWDGLLVVEGLGQTDTVAAIFDEAGNQIEYGDDEGPASNFRMTEWVVAGTYYVSVGGYNETATGDYGISFTQP